MNISFIGLGLMGIPMSKRILANGFSLRVYNRTPGKAQELVDLGAQESSLEEILSDSDIIITMLTDGSAVHETLFGKNNERAGLISKDAVVIDMSTIGVAWAERLASELVSSGVHFIDAPVTGSTPKAITGELTIFIGGEKSVVDRVSPVLRAMGTNLIHMGTTGSGQAMKMVNNHFIAVSMVGFAECIRNGERFGLDREKILDTLCMVPAVSPYLQLKVPMLKNNEYPPMFSADNILKDVRLASEGIKEDEKVPLLDICEKIYTDIHNQHLGNEDLAGVIRWYD